MILFRFFISSLVHLSPAAVSLVELRRRSQAWMLCLQTVIDHCCIIMPWNEMPIQPRGHLSSFKIMEQMPLLQIFPGGQKENFMGPRWYSSVNSNEMHDISWGGCYRDNPHRSLFLISLTFTVPLQLCTCSLGPLSQLILPAIARVSKNLFPFNQIQPILSDALRCPSATSWLFW